MATVTSNFTSLVGLNAAYSPIFGGWSLTDAAVKASAAYSIAKNFTVGTLTSTSVTGTFTTSTSGDSSFEMKGSGFLTNTWKTTELSLDLPAYSATLYGSISTTVSSGAQTGSITKVILDNDTQGKITLTGSSDITKTTATISSVTWEQNGAKLVCSGSVSFNTQTLAMSGHYTSEVLTFNGQTITLSNINVDATSTIPGFDTFFTVALAGDDVVNGSTGGDYLAGYGGNDTLDGGAGADTLVGGAGDDTYRVDLTATNTLQDTITEIGGEGTDTLILRGGNATVLISTLILDANVENLNASATGSAKLNLTGNAATNLLIGNAAANVLDGGTGADTLIGGAGNDTYVVDNSGDVVTELAAGGTDTVQSSITYTLADKVNLENLTLTGSGNFNATGNALANVLTGNSGNNTLDGGAGNDTLDGGIGADTMIGGAGNDTYVVDNAGDVVTELATGGTDTVMSSITYTLADKVNLENLTLTGSAINATGNALANILTGNSGDNLLDGGAGIDTLKGGAGNDNYLVDLTATNTLQDTVTENLGEGIDTIILRTGAGKVLATVTTLTLGANLENLDASQATDIKLNLTGNALDNVLTGNNADNILNGGIGADTLIGGAGNDTYVVDNAGDVIIELAAGGTDTVLSSITYTLADKANLENITLTGTSVINATGNAATNLLIGNAAANVLDGGTGADTLIGGAGNDTYVVDNSGDVVTELAAGGTDTVQSSIDYTLANKVNLENLTLTGSAINATGNALANVLTGNGGNNVLDGGAGNDTLDGGIGADTLTGGAGVDHFVFNTADAFIHIDTITDFVSGVDKIDLSASIFKGLGAVGTSIGLGSYLLYNSTSGALSYDADGVGGKMAITIATLGDAGHHPVSLGKDFVIIA